MTEITDNKIIFGKSLHALGFYVIYIINVEEQSPPLPIYWIKNNNFAISKSNVKNSILKLSNNKFILQINSQDIYVYDPEENINNFKTEIKTDNEGLITSFSEAQLLYIDKNKITLINLIDKSSTILIKFEESFQPEQLYKISDTYIFILRDNGKKYTLYCYDIKNNIIIQHIDFPKYTEIIGELPDGQLVLYRKNKLMIFNIQINQITKTINLENRESEYNTSDIKILKSGKITYGLKNGDIGIII